MPQNKNTNANMTNDLDLEMSGNYVHKEIIRLTKSPLNSFRTSHYYQNI